jgi:hypothetical protein
MKPALLSILALTLLALLLSAPAFSFLFSLTTPGPAPDHWDFSAFPVTWNLNPTVGSNISGSRSVQQVMAAAFNTWTSAPNLAAAVAQGANSNVSAESNSPANINLICFVCSDADFAADANTLAVTITTTADAVGQSDGHGGTTRFVGQIIKADIIFNPAVQFTTGGGSAQDLQTVATHEIGHFFGLDHSGIVRAVMFPFASNITTLSYDDVAGMSVLYPKANPDVVTGAISGTVTLGGGGLFGVHVYADSTTGTLAFGSNIRKSPIGTLTTPGGSYTIQGLPPDFYIVVAEPLDGPVSNTDVSGYAGAFGQPNVQTSFTTRWH